MEIAIPARWGGNFASLGTKEEGSFANVIIHSGGKEKYRCYRRSSSSLAWRKNRSGIGIRRSRYASFVVLLGLTRVLQSDGDLYPGSFAPLFFHRREISDEIPPERGNSLSGRRASPRWRKASRNAILEDSHTGNIHMYMNFSVRG